MSIWCRFILGSLWKAEVCHQPPTSLIGNVLALMMTFFVWHTPYSVLWRWNKRLEPFRSTSVQLLTEATVRGFYSSSALW